MKPEHVPLMVLLMFLVTTQAVWIFLDARKRGENYWLWGILGMTNVPSALIVYLLVTRNRKVRCPDCGQLFTKKHRSCPQCGGASLICPNCQQEVQIGWGYCPHCGRKCK